MMGKLYSALSVFSIATLLAVGGFAAFLYFTGRVDAARLELVAKALRGELVDPAVDVPTTMPASQPAEASAAPEARSTREDLEQLRLRHRIMRAQIERGLRDVQAQRELLDQALQELRTGTETLDQSREAWMARRAKLQGSQSDAGFQEEVKLVASLSAAQAKQHLLRTWEKQPADAVRLLKALSASKAKRILEQFRTEQEAQIMHELLEQLRNQDIETLERGVTEDRP